MPRIRRRRQPKSSSRKKAARIGGKVKQNSTECKPVSGGFECKTSAVVCP